MTKTFRMTCAGLRALAVSVLAGATVAWAGPVALQARDLDGDPRNGPEAWYSPAQNLTWLNPHAVRAATFEQTLARLERLNQALPGLDGWRLPQVLPVDGQAYVEKADYDGSVDLGWNISHGHEVGVLYHVVLLNLTYHTDGTPLRETDVRNGFGPFQVLPDAPEHFTLWQQTPPGQELSKGRQFLFDWRLGRQDTRPGDTPGATHFMAVHDGDVGRVVSVPEPGVAALLVTGLSALAWRRRARQARSL